MKLDTRTVLLVEDDEGTAEVLTEILEGEELRVVRAPTAAEARRAAEERRPDLVLLDLMLPDQDGLVWLSDLRRTSDIPVIVCSATNRRRDAVLALRLGADDFIAKPFDILEVEERVRSVLRRAA